MRKITLPILLVTVGIFYLLFGNSCANPGAGPEGGPRDSIAPVVESMVPANYSTNFKGKEITVTFDEYVVMDNLQTKLVVSPPLAEKPTIKTKGHGISIKINEDLIPDRTYSIDFKDGIKDYNEGNKLESLRMLFSTYDKIDTLHIEGYLVDAFTLDPIENSIATLYTLEDDSIFSTLRPDFIARTDDKGYFLFDNLPEGKYKLYGLVDADRNLFFSQDAEQVAYIDSFLYPDAKFIEKIDTVFAEEDTLINYTGYTEFSPGQVNMFLFVHDYYNQFPVKSDRDVADRMTLSFNETLTDSFRFELIGAPSPEEWSYVEFNEEHDSLSIWITDTTLIRTDSLYLKITYTGLDSLQNFETKIDTLKMFYIKKEAKGKPKKKEEAKEVDPVEMFEFTSNLKANNFDLNSEIVMEAPSPIESFNDTIVKVFTAINDSTFEEVPFKLSFIEDSKRKFKVSFELKEATSYTLEIDSASVNTLSGIQNLGFSSKFKTQKLDYYGNAIFNISGIEEPYILQLLKNSKEEAVVKFEQCKADQKEITFNYLAPGKYKVKLIVDANQNGKWDPGSIDLKIQPEKVYYFEKIINIKSNWDLKEDWSIEPGKFTPKKLTDDDKKEKGE